MKWTEDQLVIKDGKEYILSAKGNLIPKERWEKLPNAFTGPDDPRIKKAHTPEANSKRGRSLRARRTMKDELKKLLAMDIGEGEYSEDLDKIDNLKDLSKYDKQAQTEIMMTAIAEAINGNIKAMEFIAKVTGDFAPEEKTINMKGENIARSTMENVFEQLDKRGAELSAMDKKKEGDE